MKTIATAAMAAIEAGEAIVTGAVEITPLTAITPIFSFDHSFDYQILDSIVDADPPESVTPPTMGFDSTANAPFGHNAVNQPINPPYAIETVWLPQTSLWLSTTIDIPADGTLTFSGHIENGVLFFLDDVLFGSFNAANTDLFVSGGSPYSISGAVTAGTHTVKILALDEAVDGTAGDTDNTYIFARADLTSVAGAAPLRLWGGYGPITIDGDEYLPIGDRGLVQQTLGAIGGVAQGLTMALSGIESDVIDLLDDADQYRGASVVIRRLIFASDGKTLLDYAVWDRGRVDTISVDEVIGGTATINVAVESAARSLGKSGARMRSDSDQRLINSTDGYFTHTAYAAQKELYWGGKLPVRTGTVNGAGPVAGTIGGTGAGF